MIKADDNYMVEWVMLGQESTPVVPISYQGLQEKCSRITRLRAPREKPSCFSFFCVPSTGLEQVPLLTSFYYISVVLPHQARQVYHAAYGTGYQKDFASS